MTATTPDIALRPIPLALLDEHPLNPRLYFRQEVIDGIAESLAGTFPRDHAIRVRAVGDRYQIVDGHHRVRAAAKAGLREVWAWVLELDDEAALMELVQSNNQGELSPLEIGVHAYRAIPIAKGGRGQRGGITEYARALGKDKGQVSRLRHAGEVAETVESAQRFAEHASHLAEIHPAPRELWQDLAEVILSRGWTVLDTKQAVERLTRFDIPAKWAEIFLNPTQVKRAYIKTQRLAPDTTTRLAALAEATENTIIGLGGAATHLGNYHTWLRENTGGAAWEIGSLLARQKLIEQELTVATATKAARWNLGDWRDHVGALGEGSIALLLTDPPFGAGYQSGQRKVTHRPIANDSPDAALAELREVLAAFHPKMAADSHLLCFCRWQEEPAFRDVIEKTGLELRGSLIWAKNAGGMGDLYGTFQPWHERILHAVKGSPRLYERGPDVLHVPRIRSDRHATEKPIELLVRLIQATTVEGELVADPFGGVASTLIAATRAGRKCWGTELDLEYHAFGQTRLDAADMGEEESP